MIRVLVIAQNYPNLEGGISLQYIHSRNKWYVQNGIHVSVVSFEAKKDYVIEGVYVYTYRTYKKKIASQYFDVLISHAPNLKRHFLFLLRYQHKFENIVLFVHGHEVLIRSREYPKTYSYMKTKPKVLNDVYDRFKVAIWKRYFRCIAPKAKFVFVSKWMYNKFMEYVKIDEKIIGNKKQIIYNCVGEVFEKGSYKKESPKKYDFITIRGNIDTSKFGIDIVNRIATNNPKYRFCIVGKGKFFTYNRKPDNLDWIENNLSHNEIIELLDSSNCALMLTRTDAQGLMACEMATYGIPLITSDIEVCKEIFDTFENVAFINNDRKDIDIESVFMKLKNQESTKNKKYFSINTIGKEIELLNKIVGKRA